MRDNMAQKKAPKVVPSLSLLKGKTILITGGTGTFGHAFVSRILNDKGVKKIIVLSRDELKQSQMQHEYAHEDRLRFFIGDIRDVARLKRAFEGVDIVVHAAALKQVPATEYNPFEAIQTNIIGSKNVIDAALDCKVQKVLLISSDKAVEPINLYGATKLCAEKLFVAANSYSGVDGGQFSVVRYGNVIGSRGSLVEMIERQREAGVIRVTHEEMTRFWIKIENVMEIVLECLSLMHGGEIFVPKMSTMSIVDVVRLLAPAAQMQMIGVRPGEKMHEMLITRYEAARVKELEHVYVIPPEFGSYNTSWLKKYPGVKPSFRYVSDNDEFALHQKAAEELFKR